jgi:Zn-dependent protease with chaperone function
MLFLIWEESASPATGQWQQVAPPLGLSIFFSGYLVLIFIMRWWGNRLARGMAHGDLGRAIDRYNWGMTLARTLVPAWFTIGVFVLGWKPAVDYLFAPIATWSIVTPQTIFALCPGFLGWTGLWWSHFKLDRALREHNVREQLEADLPIFFPPTFRIFFVHKLRAELMLTIAPLMSILIFRDLVVIGLGGLSHTAIGRRWGISFPISDAMELTLRLAGVAMVLVFSPHLLRRVLSTQRLPDSELRQSLAGICTSAGIRCREILLWQTENYTGNAMIMGLIPQVRYVVLSDLLLETMTEAQIQAVFAHELGHVKHRHLVWFAVFFLSVGAFLMGVTARLEMKLALSASAQRPFEMGAMLVSAGVLWIGFGFLSRWFERQADVYAARTLEKPVGGQARPQGFGADIFASTLERVAVVNNIPVEAPNWTHGSIQSRVSYINRLGRDPKVAERFDQTGRMVFVGLILLVGICAGLAVYLLR